jgi:hypothetical protein
MATIFVRIFSGIFWAVFIDWLDKKIENKIRRIK